MEHLHLDLLLMLQWCVMGVEWRQSTVLYSPAGTADGGSNVCTGDLNTGLQVNNEKNIPGIERK